MKQEPGKRIVSKGEYVLSLALEIVWVVFGMLLMLGAVALVAVLFLLTLSGTFVNYCADRLDSFEDQRSTASQAEFSQNERFTSRFMGTQQIEKLLDGVLKCREAALDKAKQADLRVPFTRANTAALPALETLVRASEEPLQAQNTVLLRVATQMTEKQEELLRASSGGQE